MIEQGTRGAADRIVWKEPAYSLTAAGGLKKTITGTGNHADCQALINPLGTDGWDVEVTPIDGSPRSTIIANIVSTITAIALPPGVGAGGDPNTSIQISWEVDCQVSNVDLVDSTVFKKYIDSISITPPPADAADNRVKAFTRIMEAAKELKTEFKYTKYNALPNLKEKQFAWDIAGGASVYETHPALRRTAVYPRTSTTRYPDWNNAGYVFTTAQLDTYTDVPSGILGTLPPDATWLMIPDTLVYEADGRVVISAHWLYGQYSPQKHPYKL